MYPDLNPTALQELETYCINKLTDIEAFCLNKMEIRERIAKKWDDSIQSQIS